jgi:hypothetical protein
MGQTRNGISLDPKVISQPDKKRGRWGEGIDDSVASAMFLSSWNAKKLQCRIVVYRSPYQRPSCIHPLSKVMSSALSSRSVSKA